MVDRVPVRGAHDTQPVFGVDQRARLFGPDCGGQEHVRLFGQFVAIASLHDQKVGAVQLGEKGVVDRVVAPAAAERRRTR